MRYVQKDCKQAWIIPWNIVNTNVNIRCFVNKGGKLVRIFPFNVIQTTDNITIEFLKQYQGEVTKDDY
jgi:hypothetical protein